MPHNAAPLPSHPFIKGVSLAIFSSFLGACSAAMGKYLMQEVGVATVVFFQFLICFLCLLPWILRHGRGVVKTNQLVLHIVRGISGCIAFYALYLSLKHIPLVDSSLLRNTAPLVVPVVIFAWLKITIPRKRWLPLCIGFLGVAVVLRPGQHGISVWHWVGLLSGIGLAISMVTTRILSRKEPESRILFYYFVISLLCVTPFYVMNYEPIPLTALPWLIALGLIMYLALSLYTRSYTYVKPSVLAPTSYFGVVFAGLLDWVLWDHLPDVWTILGVTLVTVGGAMILMLGDGE